MGFIPPEATASSTASIIPPAAAVWSVDLQEKTSSAEILTGLAIIHRRADDGALHCNFAVDHDNDENTGQVQLSFPLRDVVSLAQGQVRAEQLIRENLSKTHPEFYAVLTAGEQEAVVATASDDPF